MNEKKDRGMNNFADALVCNEKSDRIPEEYNYFGKLVGEWDFVNVFDEGKKEVHGEWIFSWVLQGTAIQDVFISPSRKERLKTPLNQGDYAEYGTTIRFFNPATKAWDIYYCNAGAATRLVAKKEKETIVLTEVTEENIKWIFSDITETSFRWQYTVLSKQGDWVTQGELWATRRK